MGGGTWSSATYAATTSRAHAAGTTFGYTTGVKSGSIAAEVHEVLQPWKVAGTSSPLAGQIVREARDNAEHPNSLPIGIFFDETGSMADVPRQLIGKLGDIHTLLQTKGYVEDPQLCFGAYGDGALGYEVASLQVGQFESDNRADETLDNIYLEQNGGGNGGETAALAWYYLAFHTATDSFEKRGHKGYAFTIGDEITFGVTEEMVRKYVHNGNKDVTLPFKGSMTPQEIIAAVQEKWNLYHLVIDNSSAHYQGSVKFYERLLGKNAIILEDPNGVAETIALIIGVGEDAIDLDEGLSDLADIGSKSIGAVGKALAKVGATAGGGQVVVSDAPSDLATTDDDELTRL